MNHLNFDLTEQFCWYASHHVKE